MMTFGVTCPICKTFVHDESVARFLNMKAKGFHVVLSCCGQQITEEYITRCTLSISREMLAAAKGSPQ